VKLPLLALLCATLAAQTFVLETPKDDFSPSIVDASQWVEAPTGKHGFLQVKGEGFVFADGTPVRFWGAQIDLWSKETIDAAAPRMRKFGINIVRLHGLEFLNRRGAQSILDYDEAGFDRLDYTIATLGRNGIYIILDTDYPLIARFGPADHVPGLENGGETSYLEFFVPEAARLKLQRMRDVYGHRNRYTGKRYCDDPTLALVEIQNEDSMFWYAVDSMKPAHKEMLAAKLGLAPGTLPVSIGSYFDATVAKHPEMVERASLQLRQYLQLEQQWWEQARDVLRKTGVKAPICGSNWQGGGFTTRVHLYGQSKLDYVDRHGYWDHPQGEGNSKWRISTAKFLNLPMVKSMATGTDPQQENNVGNLILAKAWERVFGMPLTVSEWNTCLPNRYSLEGTGLMAAYGLLQGWGASLQFAFSSPDWPGRLSHQSFDLLGNPSQILQFPAVAAMWYRGDVKEAGVVGEAFYTPESLLAFRSYPYPVVKAAAFIGKVGHSFEEQPRAPAAADLSRYWDESRLTARSMTGELEWDAKAGRVTVNTPRTQALIGFLSAAPARFSDVSMEFSSEFGAVYVTALDKLEPIATAARLLITAVGPALNTGMEYEQTQELAQQFKVPFWRLKSEGSGPVRIEAVVGTLAIRNAHAGALHAWALDVNGKRLREVPLTKAKGEVRLGLSARDEAVYHELAER
jgi:hypothetical protein